MASPNIGVRLAPVLYQTIKQLAMAQKRTVADVARELIEQGLTRWAEEVAGEKPPVKERSEKLDGELINELKEAEKRLTEILKRVGREAAESRYYARVAALKAGDLNELYYNEINEMEDEERRNERDNELDANCQDYAKEWE